MQHIHAVVFAGSITALIAAFVLHTEYGLWRDTYISDKVIVEQKAQFDPESPGESLAGFWQEAKKRFGNIGSSSANLLEGKETYKASQ